MKKRQRKKNSNKTVSFQLRDSDEKIIEESTITLSNKDTLIMEYDATMFSTETASKVFERIDQALIENKQIIAYPKGITLKVLQVK